MENNTTTTTRSRSKVSNKQFKRDSKEETEREVAALIEEMESNPELVARTKHLKGLVRDHKKTYKEFEICTALGLLLVSLLCTLLRHGHTADLSDITVERQNYRIVRPIFCTTETALWIALFLLASFLGICFVLAEDVLNTATYSDISAHRNTKRRGRLQTVAKLCLTEALKVAVGWGELAVMSYTTEHKVFNSLRFVLAVSPRPAFVLYFVAFLHALFDAQYLVFKAFASLDKLAFQAIALSSVVYSTAYAMGSPFLGSSYESSAALVMLAVLTANVLYPVSYYYQFYINDGFSYPDNKGEMSIVNEDDDDDEENDEEVQKVIDDIVNDNNNNNDNDDKVVNDIIASVSNE